MAFKIIDCHMHLGACPSFLTMDLDLMELIGKMDRLGIEYAISSNMLALQHDCFEEGILSDMKAHDLSDGRIFTNFVFSPFHPEVALDVIRKYRGNPVCRAIKIHPSETNVDADDERWRPVWEIAEELDLPILSHTWNVSYYHPSQKCAFAGKFEKYVSEYPKVTFVFAHSGGRWDGIQAAMKIGRKYKNTYFDIAGDILGNGVLDYLVENVGADRILWGSDCYMIEQRPMLGVVLGSHLKASEKEKILRYNAKKVYFSDIF